MEPEGSFPCLQETATWHYAEAQELIPQPHIVFIKASAVLTLGSHSTFSKNFELKTSRTS
jgi:hypothetical protein